MKEQITTIPKTKSMEDSLGYIQKLVSDLNDSLLELKGNKDRYQTQIHECKELCHKVRELMDATKARIIKSGEPEFSYKADS